MAPVASYPLVAGLLLTVFNDFAAAWRPGLWAFQPDYSPAPPPQDRPPISRNATTNPADLKWQILGIVGGYVITVFIMGTLLLSVGRRLRRAAQSSHGTLSMEMVKPSRWMGDPSPGSHSIRTFARIKGSPSVRSHQTSPPTQFPAQFDDSVIKSDKLRREQEMERIYASVLNDEEKPYSYVQVQEREVPSHGHQRSLSNSSMNFSRPRPPQMVSEDPAQAVNLPTVPAPAFYAGNAPTRANPSAFGVSVTPNTPQTSSNHARNHSRHSSASSISSNRTQSRATNGSTRSKKTRSVRKLAISAPMPYSRYVNDDDVEARTPLSPRDYGALPPPPTPPGPRPVTPIEDYSEPEEEQIGQALSPTRMEQPRPWPNAAPQRPQVNTTVGAFRYPNSTSSPTSNPVSAGTTHNTLPFRQSPGAGQTPVNYFPASPTKTTYLSPRKDKFQQGLGFVGMHSAMPDGKVPLTAGPVTPYSPYMPFSPMTPVTPRLTTREDRRQRQKEEGRRVANADEDGVRDEKEIWGDGW